MSDTTRLRLLAAIVVLVVLGLTGIAVHKPSGSSTNTAASTSTSSTFSPSSSTPATAATVPSNTAAPATTTSSAAVTSTTVAKAGGSGLGSSGSGDVASGRTPTPQTGGGGWLILPGLACLGLAWGARRLARAAA